MYFYLTNFGLYYLPCFILLSFFCPDCFLLHIIKIDYLCSFLTHLQYLLLGFIYPTKYNTSFSAPQKFRYIIIYYKMVEFIFQMYCVPIVIICQPLFEAHSHTFLRSIFKKLYAYKFICMICTVPVCLGLYQRSVRAQTNIDLSLNRAFGEKRTVLKPVQKSNGSFTSKQT